MTHHAERRGTVLGPGLLFLFLAVGAASEPAKDPNPSRPAGGGSQLEGVGLHKGSALEELRLGSPDPKDANEKGGRKIVPCSADDVGTDGLWKAPSEGTKNGIVFIPPKRVCNWHNSRDILSRNAVWIRMCSEPSCTKITLPFQVIRGCLSRTRYDAVREKFGKGPLSAVLRLKDGRHLFWSIQDPFARNGAPPYPNLAHTVYPSCYRWE